MHRKRLTMDEVRIAAIGARPGPPCFPLLIASDPASTPNRRPWAPIGLRPILPPPLDALPNCPAPRHRWFQSIANNPLSRNIRVPAPPSAIQLERLVESSSLPPLGLGRLLSLPVWLSSLSLRSVPPRSRLTKTVPAPTDKCIFSYTPPFPEFVLRRQLGFIGSETSSSVCLRD